MTQIFISYANTDIDFVTRLSSDLKKAGLEVAYDKGITPGESWINSLATAIENSRYFLAVLSPAYLAAPWAQQEFNVGLLREIEGKTIIIPLMVQPCQPTGFLAMKQYTDFIESYESGLNQLLPVLCGSEYVVSQEPSAGEMIKEIDPQELRELRSELKEVVELFKSNPSPRNIPSVGSESKSTCFIVMPFGEADLTVVYEDFVKPIAENECGLKCVRGDDMFGSNVVMDDILTSIDQADIVLADLTRKNANVFYEVGVCHALGKAVLLLAQSIDDIPFDLRHRRVLLYDYTPRGCKRLEAALKENLMSMLNSSEGT